MLNFILFFVPQFRNGYGTGTIVHRRKKYLHVAKISIFQAFLISCQTNTGFFECRVTQGRSDTQVTGQKGSFSRPGMQGQGLGRNGSMNEGSLLNI